MKRSKKNAAIAILTFLELDGACAAALLVEKYPRSKIIPTSAAFINRTLDYLCRDEFQDIHICGVGIYCPLYEMLEALSTLYSKGTNIVWYCGYDYLDEYLSKLKKYCKCIFTGKKENIAETLFSVLYPRNTDEERPNLIRYVGTKYDTKDSVPKKYQSIWPVIQNLKDLVRGAIWRYFNYRDRDAYPHAIAVLAGQEKMIAQDHRTIESYRQEGNRFLLGKSKAIIQVKETINKCAPTDSAILITGETGTGKEIIARLIHQDSPRAERAFFAVNCAVLSGELQQDTLFGHVKGAFTGAIKEEPGVFDEANGGTLFLDEISELAPETQAKLLRVTQESTFQRLGERKDRRADVRIISATNRDLLEEVQDGRFREDLYYRLAVIKIHIPPLRERPEDTMIIAEDILYRICMSKGLNAPRLSRRQVDNMLRHPWHGNVRELENVLQRFVVLGEKDIGKLLDRRKHEQLIDERILPLEEYESNYVRSVYEHLDRNIAKTAKALGISRNTLKHKLSRMEILK